MAIIINHIIELKKQVYHTDQNIIDNYGYCFNWFWLGHTVVNCLLMFVLVVSVMETWQHDQWGYHSFWWILHCFIVKMMFHRHFIIKHLNDDKRKAFKNLINPFSISKRTFFWSKQPCSKTFSEMGKLLF